MRGALGRKPAPAASTAKPAAAVAQPTGKGSKDELRKQAASVGFAQGSRMLAPAAAAPSPKPATVSQQITDGPYGWASKFDVSMTERECLISVKVKLEAQEGVSAADVQKVAAQSTTAFTSFFDNKYKLTDGTTKKVYAMRASVAFVEADPHLVVKLRKGKGRDNLSNWYVESEGIVRAHELGHQLGLKDEYIDPGAESRKDASAPGVHTDNSLMGNFWNEGVATATVKPRQAQDIAGLVGGAQHTRFTAASMAR